MPEQLPRQRPGFWAQALAIMKLSARATRNQFGGAKPSPVGMRSATAYKHDRSLLLPILLGITLLAIAANSCYTAVHGLARHAENRSVTDDSGKVIKVDFLVHMLLEHRLNYPHQYAPEHPNAEQNYSKIVREIVDQTGRNEADAKVYADELIAHIQKSGIEGITYQRHENIYKFVDLRQLSPEAKAWLGRVLAVMFGCLAMALVLMPLSARNKDLGALDAQLAWYYCLPLTGREILSGRFTSMVFVKPAAWIILFPLFSVLFWAMGYGLTSVLIGLVSTLAFAVATAGAELAIETTLRTSGSYRFKKNLQSIATILGTVTFIVAMAAGVAASRSVGWIDWLVDHLPSPLTALPGKLLLLPASGTGGLITFLAMICGISIACGLAGWFASARTLRRGLSAGSERSSARLASATTANSASSLAKFEWLLLLRDRNLATLVLIVPLIMVFYQVLINPEMLNVVSAQKIAVLAFGCGIWAATMTAPHVLLSESNSLWMIFSLPVTISDHFQRRTRVWRATGVAMSAFVIAILAIWKGIPADGWWRVPAALVGVWAISLVVYALMMGNAKLPDVAKGEKPKISVIRMYGCMLVGGAVGLTLWHGTPWQIIGTLVLWWFLGFGIWQGVTRRLQYLLEPTDHPPAELTLASAIFAIIVFFFAQGIAGAILVGTMPGNLSAALLYSYIIGGVAALIYCAIRLFILDLLRPSTPGVRKNKSIAWVAGSTLACAAICIGCGWVWLTLLRTFPPLRELYETAKASSVVQLTPDNRNLVLLAVVAAPLIEELVFRGFVFKIMQNVWSTRNAILANALLFAIVHPALSFPPVFALGIATAWLYSRSQRLWPSILLHALYNAAIVAMQ